MAEDAVRAWRPAVAGVREVLHAQWRAHSYPVHTHDTWTLLLVDDGAIGYALDRHERSASPLGVTLLPPHVPHDGHPATSRGFRKRVLYLDECVLDGRLTGRAVDGPFLVDDALRAEVHRLDRALARDERREGEERLAVVAERLSWHLRRRDLPPSGPPAGVIARTARDWFDADPANAPTVTEVAAALGVSSAHLIRTFTRTFGIPPHRYVVGRRLDIARRRLLDGEDAAAVAVSSGFYDQAHLSRHFTRLLATTPARYRRRGR